VCLIIGIAATSESKSTVAQPLTSEVTPQETHEQGLTKFVESATSVKVGMMDSLGRRFGKSFPVQTPKQLLERNYVIANLTWASPFSQVVLKFPEVLFQVGLVAEVLKRFKYFRGNVRVEITQNSTPYHQGSLLISFVPLWDTTGGTNVLTNIYQLSGFNPVVLSAGLEESAVVKLPYLSPQEWMVIPNPYTGKDDTRIGALHINALNPLTCTSNCTDLSIPITITAAFTDVEVEGFISPEDPPIRNFKGQSSAGGHSTESAVKNAKGIDVQAAFNAVDHIIREAPVVGPIYGEIASVINAVAHDMSKPQSQEASKPVHATYSMGCSTGAGLDYSDTLTLYSNPNMSQSKMFAGMETSHMPITKLLQRPMLHDQVTFDGTHSSMYVLITPMAFGAAQSYPDWLYYVSGIAKFWRGSIKYTFHFVMPQFYSCTFRAYYAPDANPIAESGDMMSQIIKIKGDTKIDIMVPFLKESSWSRTRMDTKTAFQTDIPRLYLERISPVVGCTESEPIIYCNVWRAAGEDIALSQLENFDYGDLSLRGEHPRVNKARREFKGQCSMDERFKRPYNFLIDGAKQSAEKGYANPEIIYTVSDCLKREVHLPLMWGESHTVKGQISGPYCPRSVDDVFQAALNQPFYFLSSLFLFWRGGRVVRHLQDSTIMTLQVDSTRSPYFISNGGAFWFSGGIGQEGNIKYHEAITVPWFGMTPYYPNINDGVFLHQCTKSRDAAGSYSYEPPDIRTENWSVFEDSQLTIRGADDYMLLYPVPLFPFEIGKTKKFSKQTEEHPSSTANIKRQILTNGSPDSTQKNDH
jgi:hypothetical protein